MSSYLLLLTQSVLFFAVCSLLTVNAQQDFTTAQVPTFNIGVFYPGRSDIALEAEVQTCRAITDRIARNSARFNSELVTNTDGAITFATADSRLMSSRMQSRLGELARSYSGRMTVLKAWSPFPDPELAQENNSLHYEGRTVRIQLPSRADYDDLLELAVGQAAFDWVYYANADYVRLSVIPSNCVRNIDCVFVLDRSGSVGSNNHLIALQFINNVVSFFTIGSNATRVGMIAYASSSVIQFDLNQHSTVSSLQTAISNTFYTGGGTNTQAGLTDARTLLNPTNNRGARVNSLGIPKITILITDGRSNRLPTVAVDLRNDGVQVYAVGIANADSNELQYIASDPDDEHVFILGSFLDAAGFVDLLSVTTCDSPAIIDPGDNTTTTTPDGGIRYFQTECASFSNRVLVELIDTNGTSFLYASATETNPGPLTPNTESNTTTGISRRTVIVELQGASKVVYIGVQGQGQSDSFTLVVWDQLFDPVDTFIDVLEGLPAGTVIYNVRNNLTSSAATRGNTYLYSIIEGNGDGIFNVDTLGQVSISTGQGVDFNLRTTHTLTVQARNTINDCQSARIRINIQVISNSITFEPLQLQRIPESAVSGTAVVGVVASGGAGGIRYSITGGNGDGAFAINPSTGLVTVDGPLDFETVTSYSLTVQAQSQGSVMVDDTITLGIQVLDENEIHTFAMPCPQMTCRYSINENAGSTILGTVAVTDPDSSSIGNGSHTYIISNINFPFTVDAQGNMRNSIPLDRETRAMYSFVLTVRDRCSGNCAFSITTNVVVTVNDLNDNAPVFTLNPDRVPLSEDAMDGTLVAQYIATDADSGTNADILFSLSPSNTPFTLDEGSGLLTLTGSIDYETTQSYMVTVTAANPTGGQSTTTNTLIEILNVNDNSPIFVGAPYSGDVEENSPAGTALLQVEARDADLEAHGEVRFFIISGNFNSSFAIDSNNGMITVRNNIDRESISSFLLMVEARDRGTPQQRRVRTRVTVTVTDVNDNTPLLQPDSYVVQVREDLPMGEDVVQLLASDADQPDTPNAEISYSITSGNENGEFSIDDSTGLIQLATMLDFETTPSYRLMVRARDGGSPSLESEGTVIVNVVNVNENPPSLTGDQVVNVSESAPRNTLIAAFPASDNDQNVITFELTSGNEEGRFSIGSTGQITLQTTLDFETTTSYVLVVAASDEDFTTEATLTVNVLDENEFSPQFSGDDTFTIMEEMSAQVVTVGTVMASDDDRDAEVRFSFTQQDTTTALFSLDPVSGVITTVTRLDREELTHIFTLPLSEATVQVSATDNGSPPRRSFREYTIVLSDINDNSPIFSDTSYTNMLLENLPADQIVFQVAASDRDIGENAMITFSFELTNVNNGLENQFQIDSSTGEITTTSSLDFEAQSLYQFSITATDMGTPSRSTSISGTLTVVDVNDNAPIFDFPLYTMDVSEETAPSTELLTVRATDADEGRNGEVQYTVIMNVDITQVLESTETITQFEVGLESGALTNINEFDFESASQINITVFANDRGIPQMSSSTLVVLNIVNVDELPPVFTSALLCEERIPEDVSVGTTIAQCLAEDSDTTATGSQPIIEYSFSSPSELFAIDTITGEISTTQPLDREVVSGHLVPVMATDASGKISTQRVRVRLTDVNDNPPMFSEDAYSYHYTQRDVQSTVNFLTMSASDPDDGMNGTFSFSLASVDRISNTETRVLVLATDEGTPPLSASAVVTVTFGEACQLQEYTVMPTGEVSAFLLCSVEATATSLPLIFGGEGVAMCSIIANKAVSYQWLHNGTAITATQPVGEGGVVSYTISNAGFRDAGEYACKVTSVTGSLQSVGARASILVSPAIPTPPQDTAVVTGSSATFTCAVTGIPYPEVQWFFNSEQVGEGLDLVVTEVDKDKSGTYTCRVSNEAGNDAASARLTVFDSSNVVELELTGISNPSIDGQCQHFDPTTLESTLSDLTDYTVKVTSIVGGDLLCEVSKCSPSPCENGGVCSINENITTGYECACALGFTGVNCAEDENECNQEASCSGQGRCINTFGSFSCTCNSGFTGRRCQFGDACSQTTPNCTTDEYCLETFTTLSGYECVTPDVDSSLVVNGVSSDIGKLNDLIQLFIDEEIQTLTAGSTPLTGRRRRRQAVVVPLTTACEPRFIATASDVFLLVWVCPDGETTPSPEAQDRLCDFLFGYGVVTQCKLPLGEFMTTPTTTPLTSNVDLEVYVIVVDDTNLPLTTSDSVGTLGEAEAEQQLSDLLGIEVLVVSTEVTTPPPPPPEPVNVGGVVGGVVGTLLALVVIAIIVIVVVMVIIKTRKYSKRQEKKRKQALELVSIEEGDSKDLVRHESPVVAGTVAPSRPPKPTADTQEESTELNESIYQNVTKTETVAESDYDCLPPKKDLTNGCTPAKKEFPLPGDAEAL